MKKLPSTRVLAFLLVAFMVSFCSKTELGDSPTTANKVNLPGLAHVSFDAEVLNFQEVQDPSKASALQLIGAAPKAERSKIELDVYDDGSSSWMITKQEPKHDVAQHHLTPPDPSPQTYTTRIDRAGMGYFYDKNGTFLRQHPVPLPSYKAIADAIIADPKASFGAVGIPSTARLQKYLKQATNAGAIVQDLGNGLTSVRVTNTTASNAAAKTASADQTTSVDIIDTNLNLIMGSTLYDSNQEVLSKAFYSYKFDNDKASPEAIYQEVWNTDASGKKVKTISNTYFYQFSATVNN